MAHLAKALGWFSLGLGLAQVAMPRQVAQLIGLRGDEDDQKILRVVGMREIASGLGILAQSNPTPWLWARVGGDAMDLALLRSAMESPDPDHARVAATLAAVLAITAVDGRSALRATAAPAATPANPVVQARSAVTIHAPVAQVYEFWDGFRDLPRFMNDFAAVAIIDDRHSRWRLSGPVGMTLEWDVEITDAAPNERIVWRASGAPDLAVDGDVRFRPAPRDQGTEIIFDARTQPPGGEIGKTIAGFFAKALGAKIGADLRRCKQLIELGEIVQSDDSIAPGPNPAQPMAAAAA